jgi:hypothetical protein
MTPFCPFGLSEHNGSAWIARARLLAVPFAFLEVAVERGNYPPGYERWAWTTAGVFAVGAVAILFARQRLAGLVLDTLAVSAFVCIYSFEPNSPVRELFFLPVVEAALLFGARAGAAWPVTSVPALWFFERQTSDTLDVPYDVGHVLGPLGLQLSVGLVVGYLADRGRGGLSGPPRSA